MKSVQAELAAARRPANKVARELYNQRASHTASPKVCKQAANKPARKPLSRQPKEFDDHGHLAVIRTFSLKNAAPETCQTQTESKEEDWIIKLSPRKNHVSQRRYGTRDK